MLKELSLKNFKCFDSLNLSLKNLTVLTGANAVGKSTIIQSLLFLNSIKREKEKLLIFPTNIYNNNYGLPETILSHSAKSKNCEIIVKVDDEIFSFILSPEQEYYAFTVDKKCRLDDFRKKTEIYYLSADRSSIRTTSELGQSIDVWVGESGQNTIDLINKNNKNKTTINIEEVNPYYLKFGALCEFHLSKIFNDLQIDIKQHDKVAKGTLLIKNNAEFYLASGTGFGISYLLPIIVQCLSSLNTNAILLIENPEAHLHPRSQSAVGAFLAMMAHNGVQLIIETHSEHIINGIRKYAIQNNALDEVAINYFDNKEGNVTVTEIVIKNNGELSTWPDGFFDQFENDLGEILKWKHGK